MEITYLGHSAFRLKGKQGVAVTDPYDPYVGWAMPQVSADLVTVSHNHPDHSNMAGVKTSSRRDKPFIIDQPGSYEVGGISVFGVKTFHDDQQGTLRGENTVFTIMIDSVRVCHLGDLGHELSNEQISEIGEVDVLLCPVGGHFTIDAKQAIKTIQVLEPGIVIPMHYQTSKHDLKVFADIKPLEVFLSEYGTAPKPESKLNVEKSRLPEETQLVVLASPQ